MKSIVKPSFYFSAYPLKAIKEPSSGNETSSPYLKTLLTGKTKTRSRPRVFPMINPYNNQLKPAPFETEKLPNDIELTEKNWFNNYE
jgi:hypothetical protein